MSQPGSQQRLFVVFLETAAGAIKQINVKASSADVAAKRAAKRHAPARVIRVEKVNK